MNKPFLRLVALLLVPCFLMDPVSASSFVVAIPTQASLPRHVAWQSHFDDQAFVVPLVAGYTYVRQKTADAWLRRSGGQVAKIKDQVVAGVYANLPEFLPFVAMLAVILPMLPILWSQQQDAGAALSMSMAFGLSNSKKLREYIQQHRPASNAPISMDRAVEIAPELIRIKRRQPDLTNVRIAEVLEINDIAVGWLAKALKTLIQGKKSSTPAA